MPDAFLRIEGRGVEFEELEVAASLEQTAATVRARIPAGQGIVPRPGHRVIVSGPGPRNLLVGYLDRVTIQRSAGGSSIEIAGRERTADLLDGSPVDAPAEWASATLLQIARDLVLRVGITVVDESRGLAQEPYVLAAAQPGDSAWTTLERLARQRGVLLRTDEQSRLVLRAPGEYPRGGTIDLAQVEDWTLTLDGSERYATWVVRGQAAGGEFSLGAAALSPEGRATDSGARPQREALVLAQGSVDSDQCQGLAEWHAAVSAARAEVLELTLPSWRRLQPDGPMWAIGTVVDIQGPEGPAGDRLIAHATWSVGRGGYQTRLGLVRPDAYLVEPVLPEDDALLGLEALVQS